LVLIWAYFAPRAALRLCVYRLLQAGRVARTT
jgi:hypothetical protein